MYVFGCKLSLFRLCYSDYGITPVYDITIGITCTAFCFHIAYISLAGSRYLFCLSVIIIIIIIIIIIAIVVVVVVVVEIYIKLNLYYILFFSEIEVKNETCR